MVLFKPRLPTKSLLKMKRVCSQWRSIISDPRFIKAHLDAVNDERNNHLTRYLHWPPLMRSIGLEDEDQGYEYTFPVTKFSDNAEILGSCNGLILLGDDDRTYYLWNPSTRLLRKFDGPSLFRGEFRNFGFGYDSTTSAYKVVRIVRVTSHKVGLRPPENKKYCYDATSANVYNCKTNRWKKIEDFPYVIFENSQGVVVNGVPHWVMFRDHHGEDDAIDLVIVYFDLAEEKFKEIPNPNWLVHSSSFEFGVLDGRLCFIHQTKRQNEVWVMQEYGQDSWTDISSEVDIDSVCITGWKSGNTVMYSRGPKFFDARVDLDGEGSY
ncbi:F-box associated domain, type 1 [Cynara cardunculus var. scolymus]|uniref:F-box associated domain, type 1 n=1 Tax=Cynara cardunculus var. scolymus TaxID=59895 RepID=A0A118JXU1_CYNCS|nr:F-box associated domain, type 1 [Cynara cardunculus var. scolymus]